MRKFVNKIPWDPVISVFIALVIISFFIYTGKINAQGIELREKEAKELYYSDSKFSSYVDDCSKINTINNCLHKAYRLKEFKEGL